MSLRTPSSARSAATTASDDKRADAKSGTQPPEPLLAVDRALADLRRGGLVVVTDGARGLLVQAAEAVTPHSLTRLASLGRAPALLALTERRANAIGLVDLAGKKIVTLEIAEETPAQSVRDIADPSSDIGFRLPPLHDLPGDLGACAAAAVHLTKLARLLPTALIAPLAAPDIAAFADAHDLLTVSAHDVTEYEMRAARSLKPVSQARVPLFDAENARIVAYRPSDGGIEHLAIVIGEPKPDEPVLIRLHSECFTGDLLGSLRCDCGDQLRGAIAAISDAGSGLLLYLAQEGRGIGLVNKLRAYQLQDGGADTIDANEQLGFDADERLYMPAAQMLRDMGFSRVRLLTNNPDKVAALQACGIDVTERVPHAFPATAHNKAYLETKAKRSGHLF